MKLKLMVLMGILAWSLAGAAQAIDLAHAEVKAVDLARLSQGLAPEVIAPAVPHRADLASTGSWVDADGWSTWTYAVRVPGARSLAFHASATLPVGASLELSGEDGRMVKRYVSAELAGTGGHIASVLVPGEAVLLELRVPTDRRAATGLAIDQLFVGLKASPLAARALTPRASTASQVNWSCVRSSANELAGDATVLYTVNASNPGGSGPGLSQCTGTLMNDVPQDGKLYMLTAAHCGQTNYDPSSITVYWNRVSSCSAGLQNAMSVDGPTTSGGTTRALYASGGIQHEDQWLIELAGTGVPTGSEAVYLGWDASDVTKLSGGGPSNIFDVNHAADETKQYIASTNGPAATNPPFLTYTLSTGVSKDGASGSGAVESNQRLFGTLTGSGSDLSGNPQVEFMPLALSWHGDGGTDSPASSTSVWLDPSHTGTLQLDALQLPSAPTVSVSVSPTSVTVGTSYTVTWSSTGATSCIASGAWSGSQALNGTLRVTPTASGDFTYDLSCNNAGGTTRNAATEVVTPSTSGSSGASGSGGGGGGGSFGLLSLTGLAILRAARRRRVY